jgi:hypothetical protein
MENVDLQIEQYLQGQMTAREAASFETSMRQDPALKSEVQFQKNVIEAIKESKRAHLKASLANVATTTSLPLAQKIAYGIGALATIGAIGWATYALSPNQSIIVKQESKLVVEKTTSDAKEVIETTPLTKNEFIENQKIETNTQKAVSAPLAPKAKVETPLI